MSRTAIAVAAALLATTLTGAYAQARGGGGHMGGGRVGGGPIVSPLGADDPLLFAPVPAPPPRSYYGPAPGIQPPMTPVPPVAPLAQPPVYPTR